MESKFVNKITPFKSFRDKINSQTLANLEQKYGYLFKVYDGIKSSIKLSKSEINDYWQNFLIKEHELKKMLKLKNILEPTQTCAERDKNLIILEIKILFNLLFESTQIDSSISHDHKIKNANEVKIKDFNTRLGILFKHQAIQYQDCEELWQMYLDWLGVNNDYINQNSGIILYLDNKIVKSPEIQIKYLLRCINSAAILLKWQDMVQSFQKINELNPVFIDGRLYSLALFQNKKYDLALQELIKLIDSDIDNIKFSYIYIMEICRIQGDHKTIQILMEAITQYDNKHDIASSELNLQQLLWLKQNLIEIDKNGKISSEIQLFLQDNTTPIISKHSTKNTKSTKIKSEYTIDGVDLNRYFVFCSLLVNFYLKIKRNCLFEAGIEWRKIKKFYSNQDSTDGDTNLFAWSGNFSKNKLVFKFAQLDHILNSSFQKCIIPDSDIIKPIIDDFLDIAIVHLLVRV